MKTFFMLAMLMAGLTARAAISKPPQAHDKFANKADCPAQKSGPLWENSRYEEAPSSKEPSVKQPQHAQSPNKVLGT